MASSSASIHTIRGHADRHPVRQNLAPRPIQDRHQEDESAPHRDIANVGRPDLIRSLDRQILQQLRSFYNLNVMLTGARLHARPVQLKLGHDPHVVAQEFGRKVRAIRPDECVELRMNHESSEVPGITERFKNRPAQFLGEVDFSGCTIAKPEPYNIRADVPCLENVIIHSVTPKEQFD